VLLFGPRTAMPRRCARGLRNDEFQEQHGEGTRTSPRGEARAGGGHSARHVRTTNAEHSGEIYSGFAQRVQPASTPRGQQRPRARVLCLRWPCARVHFTCLCVPCPSMHVCHACACLCMSCPCRRKLALFVLCLMQMISTLPSRSEPKRHSLSHPT